MPADNGHERRKNTIELCVEGEYEDIDSDNLFYSVLVKNGLEPTKVSTRYNSESYIFQAIFSFAEGVSPIDKIPTKERLGELLLDISHRSAHVFYPDGYHSVRLGR